MNLSNHLNAFILLICHGKLRIGKFFVNELINWHGVKGYTCYIGYKNLIISLLFNSRFLYDYKKETTLSEFNRLVELFITAEEAS